MILHPVISEIAQRREALHAAIRKGSLPPEVGRYTQSGWAYIYKDATDPTVAFAQAGNALASMSNDDEGSVAYVVTTDDEDRDGDIVRPMGCQLKNYAENPVVFFGHQEMIVPIGTCRSPDGRITVYPEENRVIDVIYFDRADPDADFIYGKCKRKILNATSIAFVPVEAWKRDDVMKARTHTQGTAAPGWYFNVWDKTEVSIVGVPSNPKAVGLEKDLMGACRDCYDRERSFMSPKLQKAWRPYCAVEKGCWNGWCPVPAEEVQPVSAKKKATPPPAAKQTKPAKKACCSACDHGKPCKCAAKAVPQKKALKKDGNFTGGVQADTEGAGVPGRNANPPGDAKQVKAISEDDLKRQLAYYVGIGGVGRAPNSFLQEVDNWLVSTKNPIGEMAGSAQTRAEALARQLGIKSKQQVTKPFAGYKDFDDCVAKNKGKVADAAAYCATIMRNVEGKQKQIVKDAIDVALCSDNSQPYQVRNDYGTVVWQGASVDQAKRAIENLRRSNPGAKLRIVECKSKSIKKLFEEGDALSLLKPVRTDQGGVKGVDSTGVVVAVQGSQVSVKFVDGSTVTMPDSFGIVSGKAGANLPQKGKGKALGESSGMMGGYAVAPKPIQANDAKRTSMDETRTEGWATCSTCHGDGNCNECGGVGTTGGGPNAGVGKKDCPVCGGSGECGDCNGQGHVKKSVKRKQNTAGHNPPQIAPQAQDVVGKDDNALSVPQVLAALYSHAKAEAAYLDQLDDTHKESLSEYRARHLDERMDLLKGMFGKAAVDEDLDKMCKAFEDGYDRQVVDPATVSDTSNKGFETTGPEDTTEPGEAGLVEEGQVPPDDAKAAKCNQAKHWSVHTYGGGYQILQGAGTDGGSWLVKWSDGTKEGPFRSLDEAKQHVNASGFDVKGLKKQSLVGSWIS